MPTGSAGITLVCRGEVVRDPAAALAAAPWWVVRVRWVESGVVGWAVYGGRAPAVLAALEHHHGAVRAVVAHPFQSGAASLFARVEFESRYMGRARRHAA